MTSLKTEMLEEEIDVDRILRQLSVVQIDTNEPDIADPDLKARIQKFQTHFWWDLKTTNPHTSVRELARDIDRKIEEMLEAEYRGYWRSFSYAIITAFCFTKIRKLDEADLFLEQAKVFAKEDDLKHVYDGLMYVVSVMQAYVYGLLGRTEMANKILDSVTEYESLSRTARAAVLGVRAAALLEMHEQGNTQALPLLDEALELDDTYSEWFYMRWKAASRVNKMKNPFTTCTDSEIHDLEAAVKLSPDPVYRLSLARVLTEKAKSLFLKQNRVPSPETSDLNSRARDLYAEVLKDNPTCARTNVDCADGFIKLPYPYRDYTTAENCVEKALELAPNNSKVYHRAATLFDYKPNATAEDYERSLQYYEKAVKLKARNIPAAFGWVKLKLSLEPQYDPVPYLDNMKKHVLYVTEDASIEIMKGFYYWTRCGDAKKAAKAWSEAMKIAPDSFRDVFMRMPYSRCFRLVREEPRRLQDALNGLLKKELEPSVTEETLLKIIQLLQELVRSSHSNRSGQNHYHNNRYGTQQSGRGFQNRRTNWIPRGRGKGKARGEAPA